MIGVCRRCLRTKSGLAHGLCWRCRAPERRKARRAELAAARRPLNVPADLPAEIRAIVLDPRRARLHMIAVHGDACFECGAPGVELDHHRPLWSMTAAERLDIKWWTPFNLSLLCVPDHRAKTRREAAQRATLRSRRTG